MGGEVWALKIWFLCVKNEPKAISHINRQFWQSDVVLISDKNYALGAVQVAVRRAKRTAPHLEKLKNTNLISSWALYVQRLWTAPVQRQNTVPPGNKWALYEQRFWTAPVQRQNSVPLGNQLGAVRTALLYSACTATSKHHADLIELNAQNVSGLVWALYVQRPCRAPVQHLNQQCNPKCMRHGILILGCNQQ